MNAAHNIPLSEELYREVSQRARETGVSPKDWAAAVLAKRVEVERLTDRFFATRTAGASSKPLGELLDKAPDRPPDACDEL